VSHTTTLKSVSIKDASAIRQAVAKLKASGVNIELRENEKPRMYYSNQHGKCDFVLKLSNGSYDVGLEKQADGSYAPVFDEWAGHVANSLGSDVNVCPMPNTPEGRAQHQIGKFMQAYTECAAVNTAAAQGYIVDGSYTDDSGNVHLMLSGMM